MTFLLSCKDTMHDYTMSVVYSDGSTDTINMTYSHMYPGPVLEAGCLHGFYEQRCQIRSFKVINRKEWQK